METLTAPQVLALAPDAASVKAGQALANPAKWQTLGCAGRSVWGECQGSALYRTQADLAGPAFHCSCPSRKFPCKHGLGLLLALAGDPAHVPEAQAPEWVAARLAKRAAGAEKKAAKPDPNAEPTDPEAAAKRETERGKRAARREDRAICGLIDLQMARFPLGVSWSQRGEVYPVPLRFARFGAETHAGRPREIRRVSRVRRLRGK